MTLQNQLKIWAALFVVMVVLLWVFRGILLPFIAGIALAYLLNPVVTVMERARIGRGWASALVLGVVVLFIVWALLLIVPPITGQLVGLAQGLPGYVSQLQALANQYLPEIYAWLGIEPPIETENGVSDIFTRSLGLIGAFAAQLAQNGLTLLNAFGLIIIAPVVAFYMLLDWPSMMRYVDGLLPREHRIEIQGLLGEIDRAMAGVIRGQGSLVVVLTFYYAVGLTVTGLSFGLAVGLLAGVLSFMPYVGFVTGFVLAMGIAIVQFWPNWVMILVVFMVFAVGSFLEGNVLYPKLVGSSIGVSPVWLMFALFAFALLFGVVGLLLAVPLSAFAGVLTRYAIRKYKQSSLYLGRPGGNTPAV